MLLIFTLFFAVTYGWGLVYFPVEIVNKTAVSILPWLFSGLAAYFLAGFVILEPIWKYRILYIITGGAFIFALLQKAMYREPISPHLLPLLAFVMMLSISSLFSIYRFRKGEM